jgi:hypothetical protein
VLHPKIRAELKVQLLTLGPLRALTDKLIIVKVGDPESPATADDLNDITATLCDLLKGVDLNILVTHHNVELITAPPNTEVISRQNDLPDELV